MAVLNPRKIGNSLLNRWVQLWMFIRRLPALEMSAWWISDRLYNLAMLIRQGSESLTLHQLDDPTPDRVIANVLGYNRRAAGQHKPPVTATHIAVVRCMDRRLDLSRIFGDLKFVDDIANPYGAVTPNVIEALKIAVAKHGVRVIFLLEHTGCAARQIAHGDEADAYPLTAQAVHEHEENVRILLGEPVIDQAMREGRLQVVCATIVTESDRLESTKRYVPDDRCWLAVAE